MKNQVIQDRLKALREVMKESGIDYYMMPTADFHNSEYVNDYFKVREYFCNFSGSNGTLLVWQEGAGLWTDGRYFIQAERELEGTGVELFRMLDEGVPILEDFLEQHMEQGQTLGFDGRVVSCEKGKKLEEKLADKEIRFAYEKDLAEGIWTDRPAFPHGKVTALSEELAGRSTEDKQKDVMEKVSEAGADSFFLTKLDDLMWLFNIRGCDVECNPVAMSYGYLTKGEAVLFIQKSVVDEAVAEYFREKKITVKDYAEVSDYLKALPQGGKVLIDDHNCSYAFYKILSGRQTPVEKKNPTELLKAVKNPVELANMEKIYLKDSVALTKYICWLKTNIGRQEITEITAADYLERLRLEIPECFGLSFPSISAYGANAAMMHYEPTPEDHAVLKPEGLYLIDSGGQYLGGTTDVTRTVALGPVSDEIKRHYTVVAAGMLQLTNAHWIHGCTGRNLDILARQPIWDMDLDYKCGTGHGVGYILNVHEGPQNLRWRFTEGMTEAVIEAGMDVSNEPGIYVEGSHGIRIENIMVAENDVKNEYGQFMHFRTLTWVPIDMDAIDLNYMSEVQKEMLREYQQKVYEKVSPYLTAEEAEWLERETRVV
ncbi:MAG: aminopeptidase P family protein [Eubacterium sp.]|nr:aminopeptidase P family protein [Eubacterium sp.]MCM1305485.1 aminopeptidase P family protein [Butyrivibrio sp.]MCM1409009.1 aminopeptidase P family protein [Lachnospiraceae bacterium]